MKFITVAALMFSSFSALASDYCVQVSSSKGLWSRTPESICVSADNDGTEKHTVTLKTGLSGNETVVAAFSLSLVSHARCIGCNRDMFAIRSPSNSTFNALSIEFDGSVNSVTNKEEGTVSIGETKFYYRSMSN